MNRKSKRIFSWLLTASLSVLWSFNAFARPVWPSDTGIKADAGIVMDFDSEAVLFGQNIHLPYAPASITKLLTALVVIENASLTDMVTFSQDAVYNVEDASGNKYNMETGDRLSVEDCLYLLLLQSSNQAGNALAEHVAGSRAGFVDMMNKRIARLGCKESHFANPTGLNDGNQYVSAYDMALIARAAFSNPKLLEIDSAKKHTIGPTIHNPNGATFPMEHKLLMTEDTGSDLYCEGVSAGKTGYTSLAGNTLVTYASRDGQNLISVILKGTQPQYYIDCKTLLEFGFANFKTMNVARNETGNTSGNDPVTVGGKAYSPSDLYLDEGGAITVPKGAEFKDANKELVTTLPEEHPMGAIAQVLYSYDGRQVGGAWLYSREAVAAAESAAQASSEPVSEAPVSADPQETGKSVHLSQLILPAVILLAVIGASALAAYVIREKKKEREDLARRRERRRQRLIEGGMSEEEFERLRRQRFGDKPQKQDREK